MRKHSVQNLKDFSSEKITAASWRVIFHDVSSETGAISFFAKPFRLRDHSDSGTWLIKARLPLQFIQKNRGHNPPSLADRPALVLAPSCNTDKVAAPSQNHVCLMKFQFVLPFRLIKTWRLHCLFYAIHCATIE
jgi:hypothetical protein